MKLPFEVSDLEVYRFLKQQDTYISDLTGKNELSKCEENISIKNNEISNDEEAINKNKRFIRLLTFSFSILLIIVIAVYVKNTPNMYLQYIEDPACFIIDKILFFFVYCLPLTIVESIFKYKNKKHKKNIEKLKSDIKLDSENINSLKVNVAKKEKSIITLIPKDRLAQLQERIKWYEAEGRNLYNQYLLNKDNSLLRQAALYSHPIAIVKSIVKLLENELLHTTRDGFPYFYHMNYYNGEKQKYNDEVYSEVVANNDKIQRLLLMSSAWYLAFNSQCINAIVPEFFRSERIEVFEAVQYLQEMLYLSKGPEYSGKGNRHYDAIDNLIVNHRNKIVAIDPALYKSMQGFNPFVGASYDEIYSAIKNVKDSEHNKNKTGSNTDVELVYIPDVTDM